MYKFYQGLARVFRVLYRDELIDIYKTLFQINILQLFDFSKFLCGLGEEFPTLSMGAFEVIVPFQNSYLFEARLSLIMTIKQNIDLNGMRLSLSPTVPRISDTVRRKQAQKSP